MSAPAIISIGDQFGLLTILGHGNRTARGRNTWRCICACGNERDALACELTSGRVHKCYTCGHVTTFRDLTGRTFGRLVVLARDHSRSKFTRWLCQCQCGKQTSVLATNLISGASQSCGCLHNELLGARRWTGHGKISGQHWAHIQRQAKERNLEFRLSITEAWQIFLNQHERCALSGMRLSFGKPKTASLDRINSRAGYTKVNCQWVHKVINRMKGSLDERTFISFCSAVSASRPAEVIL